MKDWELAIFYPELKGKSHQQLYRLALHQITASTDFSENELELIFQLLWKDWENPKNLREFLLLLNSATRDFEWRWYDDWNLVFAQMNSYPYVWEKYRRKRKITEKEIKVALLYHSVYNRFAILRRYESHYSILEECTWLKKKSKLRLSLLDDDPIEKEIVENLDVIQNNQLLMLPPYIPAGRASIMFDRLRT